MEHHPYRRERSSFPWMKLLAMIGALAIVIWFIIQLNRVAGDLIAPDAAPAAVTPDAPPPEGIEIDLAPDVTPVPADDPPETDTVTPPPLPDGNALPDNEMTRLLMDRIKNTVSHVYDGDTVMMADGRRVRYLGIDTPEDGEPYFNEATQFNKQLVQMQPVVLEVCKKKPQDEYGRTLARVIVNGEAAEDTLLAMGLGEVFHDPACVADCRKNWNLLLTAFRNKRGMFAKADAQPVPAIVADRLLDRYGIVEGVVDNVKESTNAYHLNFGSDWTTDFSATILRRDVDQFLRDKLMPHQLVGLKLQVFGKVTANYGPRIFLDCPAQVLSVSAP
ncbi:MAG TPA: thermonuclease family protein [bacterium]|nr:thermonuclease family protein [bacterium]